MNVRLLSHGGLKVVLLVIVPVAYPRRTRCALLSLKVERGADSVDAVGLSLCRRLGAVWGALRGNPGEGPNNPWVNTRCMRRLLVRRSESQVQNGSDPVVQSAATYGHGTARDWRLPTWSTLQDSWCTDVPGSNCYSPCSCPQVKGNCVGHKARVSAAVRPTLQWPLQ